MNVSFLTPSSHIQVAYLLPASYIIFFLIPQFYFDINPGIGFWILIGISIPTLAFAFYFGSHMLQFYLTFFMFILVFGYFIQLGVGIRYIPGLTRPLMITGREATLIIIHFSGLLIGALLHGTPEKYNSIHTRRVPSDFFLIGFAAWIAIVFFAIGLVGTHELFSPRNEQLLKASSSAVIFFIKAVKAASFVMLLLCVGIFVNGRRNLLHKLIFLLVLCLVIYTANPINTARFISLTGMLLVFSYFMSINRRVNNFSAIILLLPIAAAIVLPVTSLLRTGLTEISGNEIFSMFSGLEFSSIQMLIDGVAVSDQLSFQNYIASGLFILVPRSLFPLKAESLGMEIADHSGYTYLGAAVPTFFAAYVDFGHFGAFLFSCILGFIAQWVHLRNGMNVRKRSDGYKLILFSLTPIIVRGDFSTAMISLYAFLLTFEIFRVASFLVFWRKSTHWTVAQKRSRTDFVEIGERNSDSGRQHNRRG